MNKSLLHSLFYHVFFHQRLLFLFIIHLSSAFSVFWSINDQFIVFCSKVLFYNHFLDKQTNRHTKQRAWKTYISVCTVHAGCNYVRAPRVKTDLRSFEGRTQPVKTVMETALSNNTCRHKQSKESTSLSHNIWWHEQSTIFQTKLVDINSQKIRHLY